MIVSNLSPLIALSRFVTIGICVILFFSTTNGYWNFWHQATNDFVGRGGIQHVEVGGRPAIEVGYTVASAHWGQGYAIDIAQALGRSSNQQAGLNQHCLVYTD